MESAHITPELLIVTLLGVTVGKFIGHFPALQELLPGSSPHDFFPPGLLTLFSPTSSSPISEKEGNRWL